MCGDAPSGCDPVRIEHRGVEFSFTPRVETERDVEALQQPVTGGEYVKSGMISAETVGSEQAIDQIAQSLVIEDALSVGVLVFTPCLIESGGSSDPPESISPVYPDFTPGDSPVIERVPGTDDLFRVDTKWDVSVDSAVSVLFSEPAGHTDSIVEVVPEVLSLNASESIDSQTVPIRPIVRVRSSGQISKVNPIVQLTVITETSGEVAYRSMTDEELSELEKDRRKMQFYPEWYENNRVL